MTDRDTHRSDFSFGRALEVHILDGQPVEFRETLVVPEGSDLVAFALSDSDDNPLQHPEGIRVELRSPRVTSPQPRLGYQEHREMRGQTLVNALIVNPPPGEWEIVVSSVGNAPFKVHLAGLKTDLVRATVQAPLKPGVKCKVCKIATKALALAIVATTAGAAVPAAVAAAVAAFLGVAVAGVAAFIGSLVGDGADVVSTKLCRAVRLCP